jgi:hypothetical protein
LAKIHEDILENWEADDWTASNEVEDDGRSRFTLLRQGRMIVSDTLLNLHLKGMERAIEKMKKE